MVKLVYEDSASIGTYQVTGEGVTGGIATYVMDFSYEPPLAGIAQGVVYLDKRSMEAVRMEGSGAVEGLSFSAVITSSYESFGESFFPLEFGKEYKVIETARSEFTVRGETDSDTETNTYIYKIEAVELITVPAGTFRTFKITKYDEAGTALSTSWTADKVKHFDVKAIDYEEGISAELLFYSVN